MTLNEYDFELPEEFIAQHPAERRDESRLMVLDRSLDRLSHKRFSDLPELLVPGDLLVYNDTRVLAARLHTRRAETGGAVELLLLRRRDDGLWSALARPARRLKPGEELRLDNAAVRVVGREDDGVVVLQVPPEVVSRLERFGELPLPPYIKAFTGDPERYQTVYAREAGSVAAPTAGLHFTPELLSRLDEAGVERAAITLHVGPGTFLPVRAENLDEHRMHSEAFRVPLELPERIAATRARGGRVVAVGTTTVRALETVTRSPDLAGGWSETDVFIRPGHAFEWVDAMITNFHLPRSTLLMLVCAFAGRERVMAAYREAVACSYRFYSFGDAMVIL